MLKHIKPALLLLLFMTVLTGAIYPLTVTGITQLIFPKQANGSLLIENGKLQGSELIGQAFTKPEYFWSRPSATAPFPYNAKASSGSNLALTNPAFLDAIKSRMAVLKAADAKNETAIPIDLLTASGSGLDPHISIVAANYQVERVAKARHLKPETVQDLVKQYTEYETIAVLGAAGVNVLRLNLALDKLKS